MKPKNRAKKWFLKGIKYNQVYPNSSIIKIKRDFEEVWIKHCLAGEGRRLQREIELSEFKE